MAYASRRRSGGRSGTTRDWRRPDAYRVPLADDVSTTFLAQLMASCVLPPWPALTLRCGIFLAKSQTCHAPSFGADPCVTMFAPIATWAEGDWRSFTRSQRATWLNSPTWHAAAVDEGFTAMKCMAVPPTLPIDRPEADSERRSHACCLPYGMRWATRSISWLTVTRALHRRWD